MISRDTKGSAQTTFTHEASIVSSESKNDARERSKFCGDYIQYPYKPRLLGFNQRGNFNYQFYLSKVDLDVGFHHVQAQKQEYHGFVRIFCDDDDTSCCLFFNTEQIYLEQLQNNGEAVTCQFSFLAFGDRNSTMDDNANDNEIYLLVLFHC